MRYYFQAVVERQVLDTITLSVETDDGFEDALSQARKALATYPRPVEQEGVRSMYTENRENVDAKIVHIERRVPTQDGAA